MTTANTDTTTTDMADPELTKTQPADDPVEQVASDDPTSGEADDGSSSAPWPSKEHPPDGEDLVLRWRRIDARGGGRQHRLLKALGGLVVILIIAALAVLAVRNYNQNNDRHSALAAAKADGKLLGTFRYEHINQDLKAMEDNSTKAFGHQYVVAQSNLTKLLAQYKADSIGSVAQAAVQSVSSNKATVLLFLNQAVTNSAVGSQPKSEPSRVIMTLVRPGSKWLISNVQVV